MCDVNNAFFGGDCLLQQWMRRLSDVTRGSTPYLLLTRNAAALHTTCAQGDKLVRSRGQQTSRLFPETGEEGEGAVRGGEGAEVQRVATTARRDRASAAKKRG